MPTRRQFIGALGLLAAGLAGATAAGCSDSPSSSPRTDGGRPAPAGVLAGRTLQVRRDPG